MGTLRILLAFLVLLGHSPFAAAPAGQLAVEGFFIISGFYMALLLDSKKYSSLHGFYFSRWWRLWPVFLAASFVMLVAREISGHSWLTLVKSQNFDLALLTVVSNTFMVGLDAVYYAQTHGLTNGDSQSSILILPPSWSLALEVLFVLISPSLSRLSLGVLAFLALGSQIARSVALAFHGYADAFWDYRFFPFECGLFIAGMIAYRMWNTASPSSPFAIFGALSTFFALSAFMWPISFELSRAVFLISLFLGVPGLFSLSKSAFWDRWIGDLSYSFYLWHLMPLGFLGHRIVGQQHPVFVTAIATLVTLALSALSQILIQSPVDDWRHRLASGPVVKTATRLGPSSSVRQA